MIFNSNPTTSLIKEVEDDSDEEGKIEEIDLEEMERLLNIQSAEGNDEENEDVNLNESDEEDEDDLLLFRFINDQ